MSHLPQRILVGSSTVAAGLACLTLAGCGVGMEPLMPTPVLYTEGGFSPLEHIPENEQWIPRRVYYATNRARSKNQQEISYGNSVSEEVSVGLTLIGFGGPDMSWADLNRVSTQSTREAVVKLSIAGVVEAGRFRPEMTPAEAAGPTRTAWLLEDLNDSIEECYGCKVPQQKHSYQSGHQPCGLHRNAHQA